MSQKTSSFVLDYSNSTLKRRLGTLTNKIGAAVLMYTSTKAIEYEAYMKINRPWTDRSFKAKNSLNTKVSQPKPTLIRMTLAHGVEYGIWLELANEKKYAIIGPTINVKGSDLVAGMNNLLSKIKL